MQFILSKLLAVLIYPANWIIFLTVLCFLVRSKTWKKRLVISTVVLSVLSTNPFLFRSATLHWQTGMQAIGEQYEVGILPGGLSGYDQSGNGHFGAAADRFIQTCQLYRQGVIKNILVTGGNGNLDRSYPPEADFLKKELEDDGIPSGKIFVESRSRNTHENAIFTKQLLDSLHFTGKAVLVTSAIHMPRCQLEFTNAGIATIAFPCNYEVIPEKKGFFAQIWPDLTLPARWGPLCKEWIGFLLVKHR